MFPGEVVGKLILLQGERCFQITNVHWSASYQGRSRAKPVLSQAPTGGAPVSPAISEALLFYPSRLRLIFALIRAENNVGANVSRILLRYFLAKRHHAHRLVFAVAHNLEPAFVS
jgi:hypothetical protein